MFCLWEYVLFVLFVFYQQRKSPLLIKHRGRRQEETHREQLSLRKRARKVTTVKKQQTVLNIADRAAEDKVRDSDENLMVEENVFKVLESCSWKKANEQYYWLSNQERSSKQVKREAESSMEEEEGDCAEDSQPHTDSQLSPNRSMKKCMKYNRLKSSYKKWKTRKKSKLKSTLETIVFNFWQITDEQLRRRRLYWPGNLWTEENSP